MKLLACLSLLLLSACSPSDSWLKNRIVRVMGDRGMCTGEQVRAPSGTSYILTAGHCLSLPHSNGILTIKTQSGKVIKRRIIAEDPYSDLLLLEGLPKLRGLDVGTSWAPMDPVRALTHGGNFDLYETKGMIIQLIQIPIPYKAVESEADEQECNSMPKQEVQDINFFGKSCVLTVYEMATTVAIRPGSSGGPLFNGSGELIGVASASDQFAFGHFVTVHDIRRFLAGY